MILTRLYELAQREHLQAGMAMALISGVGLAVLTLLAAVFIVTPIFGDRTGLFVEMMAPLCLVSSLNIVPSSTLSRRMAFRRLSEIEVFSTLSRVIACMLCDTNNTVRPWLPTSCIFSRHFFWNRASPTASTSSTSRISGSR